jgi:hypothetical protein
MDKFIQQYNLDRKAASKLLKVSVRTVDRYIKKKVLTAQNIGGRVWLNKDEIYSAFGKGTLSTIDNEVDTSTSIMSIDIPVDKTGRNNEFVSTPEIEKNVKRSDSSQFYQKLYEETREELREKQERLEIANYRVGQLEAQLKNSIPLLEYHRESSEKKLEKAKLLEQKELTEKALIQTTKKLRFEEYNKKLILTILLILLALQPLWLLLLAK